MFDFSHFLHGSKTVVIIILGALARLALISALPRHQTALPRSSILMSLLSASAFALKILPRFLPCKNASTTTLGRTPSKGASASGGAMTLGSGMAISGGGTPGTGGRTPFRLNLTTTFCSIYTLDVI